MKTVLAIIVAGAFMLLGISSSVSAWTVDVGMATNPSGYQCATEATERIIHYWIYEDPYIDLTHHLKTSDCTCSIVLKYLDNDFDLPEGYMGEVRYWNNIGHGNSNSLKMYDGYIDHDEFENRDGLNTAHIVFINSCFSFQDPLKEDIVSNHPDVYIGGIGRLKIGPSDECCADFWMYHLEKGYSVWFSLWLAQYVNGLTGDYGKWEDNGYAGMSDGNLPDNINLDEYLDEYTPPTDNNVGTYGG